MSTMQVVILAGGLGTRLQGVAPHLPKALVPVAGRPFIERQFDLLRAHGLAEVLLCIGAKGEMIEQHVGDGWRFGMQVAYSREDPQHLLGTGGALIHAWPLLKPEFLVLYGDAYLTVDYQAVIEAFRRRRAPALMCVYRNEGRWVPSNARVADGWVVYYSKRAKPGEVDYIDYGLSAFRRDALEPFRGRPLPLDLAVIQETLAGERKMAAFEAPERFYEIGTPERLRDLERYLEGKRFEPRGEKKT
jgi:MurNAc alpha-1-phosphate uridylyltransferase